MPGFNIVKYTVKDGMESKFLDVHNNLNFSAPGFIRGNLIKTGDREYCYIGEWNSADDSIKAEDSMVAVLDRFRDTLEDRNDGSGVTDFAVGDSIASY